MRNAAKLLRQLCRISFQPRALDGRAALLPTTSMARGLCVFINRLALSAGLATFWVCTAESQQQATVAGVVRDSAGVSLADVEVSAGQLRARTDARGGYRLTGVEPGTVLFSARRLGFKPVTQLLPLAPGEVRQLDVRLMVAAALLADVDVTARREAYDSRLAGFNARSKQHIGHFVTRERIDRANSTRVSDMLREVPGVRVGPPSNQGRSIRLRGAMCPPLVYVDGFPATAGEFDLDMIDLQSVEGIEVYAGMASVPAVFNAPRELDRCGVIAVWSRPSRAKRGDSRAAAPEELAEAYTRDDVDVAAQPDSGNAAPVYPDSLFRAQVSGKVVVEFVVDTLGAVELESIEVLASSDSLFTLAVREALGRARFVPARRQGRGVRQIVQYPFVFSPALARHPEL